MLNGVDRYSPTWIAVEAWARSETDGLRRRLEEPGLDPVRTEFIRGRIDQINRLVAAVTEPRQAPIPSGPDETKI